jgi:LacI family transcriptional regulator
MSHITLKQLAAELNLSISTVSKALKDSYEINEKTIQRVKKLAKKYHYRPNKTALNLKNRQTKTIGVIIPNILNYFFAKVLLGIEQEANEKGYQIIICLSNNKYSKEAESLLLLSDGSVDGFILSIAKETQIQHRYNHFEDIIGQDYPMVMFDRVSDKINCDKVIINDYDAAYEATDFLLQHQRKKIALISTINDLNIGKSRIKGYMAALDNNKNYKNEPLIVEIHQKTEYTAVVNALFKEHKDIDGIFATDNVSAITAMKIAKSNGYQIPKDISVIGFSNNKISRLSCPPLTVISQNALEMGKKAASLLIDRIATNSTPYFTTATIDAELIVREST